MKSSRWLAQDETACGPQGYHVPVHGSQDVTALGTVASDASKQAVTTDNDSRGYYAFGYVFQERRTSTNQWATAMPLRG
jgi:hypothetical protein